MKYTCPVCEYAEMGEPPIDWNICVRCGTEFNYDDANTSHEQLRAEWVAKGRPWLIEPDATVQR